MCLFIVCETKFTIGESRTISHANDTQVQQVAPNPRPGRFSTETPSPFLAGDFGKRGKGNGAMKNEDKYK